MKVTIIGGGIIGLCSAYYLHKAGCEVEVLEKGKMADGCSYGNAGLIVPSHIIPLAAPGMIAKGVRWMFNTESPFYVKPRFDKALWYWGMQFYRKATAAHVTNSAALLRDFNQLSKSCYAQLAGERHFNIGYKEKGLLMLYKTETAAEEEFNIAKQANALGIAAKILSVAEVQAMEPELSLDILGAAYYPGDAQLMPEKFMQQLRHYLLQEGVNIYDNTAVHALSIQDNRIQKIHAGQRHFDVEEVVLAAGSWSQQLARLLPLRLPLQAGKGYSITVDQPPKQPRHPSILTEAKVAVTPMGKQLRFAGTMEIGGINGDINPKRVQGILKSVPRYLPDFNIALPPPGSIWHGLRPCSPDGLPYIGRSKRCSNLIVATGHAMMGVSLAPASGLLVSELIQQGPLSLQLDRMSPDRFL